MARFPMWADGRDEAIHYLGERARQGLIDGWKASRDYEPLAFDGRECGVRSFSFSPSGQRHQTVYIYRAHRRRGLFAEHLLRTRDTPVVTTPDDDLEHYLERHGVRYQVIADFIETQEYRLIAELYGEQRAARSGLYYMNHIDEGLAVLGALGASDRARRAFCLHPVLQNDEALAAAYAAVPLITMDPQVLVLALEFRKVANAAPPERALVSADEIALSPLPEVNDMLRADKLQNYKDFLAHHAARHPRADELVRYFGLWLERLGIDEAARARLFGSMEPFER
jgi:hypothetical protein